MIDLGRKQDVNASAVRLLCLRWQAHHFTPLGQGHNGQHRLQIPAPGVCGGKGQRVTTGRQSPARE